MQENTKKIFIITLNYKKPLHKIQRQVVSHRAHLDKGFAKGILIASGPKIPRTGGVVISLLQDREELMDFLYDDPYFIHDLVEYDVQEFIPNKGCKEFCEIVSRIPATAVNII